MPLKTLTLTGETSWSFSKVSANFKEVKQGSESRTFEGNYPPATVQQAYIAQVTLAAAGTLAIDLQAFDNLIDEAAVLTGVKLLWLTTTGTVTLAPGGANGLVWFWSGTLTIKHHIAWEDLAFTVVDATHKTLTLTNPGGTPVDVFVLIGGKTT